MKRRRFLSLLGATAAAPMMPALPAAAVPAATVNQYTYGLAALHSRIEPGLAISEMARRFNLNGSQAEAIAQRLVREGFATRSGGIVRAKRMFVQSRGFGTTAQRARARRDARMRSAEGAGRRTDDISMIGHLHQMCVDHGLTLSPRAIREGAMV